MTTVQCNHTVWNQLLHHHDILPTQSRMFTTLNDAIDYCHQCNGHVQVLVTGSLHLVGAVMNVLDIPV